MGVVEGVLVGVEAFPVSKGDASLHADFTEPRINRNRTVPVRDFFALSGTEKLPLLVLVPACGGATLPAMVVLLRPLDNWYSASIWVPAGTPGVTW